MQISSLQLKFELAMYTCARTCTDVCTSDEKKKNPVESEGTTFLFLFFLLFSCDDASFAQICVLSAAVMKSAALKCLCRWVRVGVFVSSGTAH